MTQTTDIRLLLVLATMGLSARAHSQVASELSRMPQGPRVNAPLSAIPAVTNAGAPATSAPQGAAPASAITSIENRSPVAAAPARLSPALSRSPGEVLPRNLFQLPEDAMVNLHGKAMRAGDLQRQLSAALARAPRGAPSLFRYPRHKPLGPTSDLQATPTPAFRTAAVADGRGSDLVLAPSGLSRTMLPRPKPCSELTPEVARTRGAAVAGRSFVIEGYCLGDRPGSVELIGAFQGGRLQPAFQAWAEDRIVAVMPSVRGVPDQSAAVVVTRSDNSRSSAYPIRFVAQRERVEVPPGIWNPDGNVDQTTTSQDGGNIFSGFHVTGTGGSIAGNFSLRINPQCALDDLEIPTTAGGVLSVTGFEAGPTNQAEITVTYGPNCTTHTFDYVVGSESSTVCRVAFQLQASANCPAGMPP